MSFIDKSHTVPDTADGWQIYSSMDGADGVAAKIASDYLRIEGEVVAENLSTITTASITFRRVYDEALVPNVDFGSTDTEPRDTLSQLIEERIGHGTVRVGGSGGVEVGRPW